MKNLIIKLLAIVPALTLTFTPATALAGAGTARFSLSPASGTYLVESTISTAVSFTTNSEPVNAVTVKLDYDHAKLQLTGIDATGSVFDQGFVSGDSVTRYSMSGTFTSGKVATANFKVLGNSGTVTIGFAAGSQIARSNPGAASTDIWDSSNTLGGTYTMSAPAVKAVTTVKKTTTVAKAVEETAPVTVTPEPVVTAEPKKVTTETTIGDENGDSKKDDAKTTSSSTWLRLLLLGIAAVGFGYAASRRTQSPKKVAPADAKKAVKPEAKTAAVAKKSKKAAPKKSTPKKTKKTVKKSKK